MDETPQPERRTLDGPMRRIPTRPSVPPKTPAAEASSSSTETVLPATPQAAKAVPPVEPIEPVFEYRKPKQMLKWKRWALWVLIGVIVVVVGWFGWKAFSAVHKVIGKAVKTAPGLAGNVDATQLKGEGDGRVNILLLGVGGQGHEAPDLSDTIMVASIDPKTKDVAMLSIPRDLYVKLPAVKKYATQYSKLNAANAYGGPEYAKSVVQNIIGVPIHYYVLVDFSGFRQAVDAVGGVDINVKTELRDPMYPCDDGTKYAGLYCPIDIKAGAQHMNGATALKFARSRETTSDFDRAARQQMVLVALREKALQVSTLTNPVKLSNLIDSVGDHVKTDLQLNEIKKLAEIAKDIDTSKITNRVMDADKPDSLLVGGSSLISGAGYIELPKAGNFDYSEIQDMVKNIFVDHYITDENARIEVQNGSGVPGLAGQVVTSLKAAHYNASDPVNAPDHYSQTVIYDYTGGKKPYTINYLERRFGVKAQRASAPAATPVASPSGTPAPAPEIRIILGSDYKRAGSTSQ